MGRNRGGGGRSYDAPVMYEPSTTVHGIDIGLQVTVLMSEDVFGSLSVDSTSSADTEVSVGGDLPQLVECEDNEQIELWLAALREFLEQFEQQGAAFCQVHQLAEEVAAQLAQAIGGLLTIERGQLKVSELSAIYHRVQQILLMSGSVSGGMGW